MLDLMNYCKLCKSELTGSELVEMQNQENPVCSTCCPHYYK